MTGYDYFKIFNILLLILVIFFQRKKPTSTLLWVLVIMFMPIVGFVTYLFIGQDFRKSRIFRIKAEEDIELQKTIHRQRSILYSKELLEQLPILFSYADNVNLLLNSASSPLRHGNKIDLIINGDDLFEKLYQKIESADSYVHLQSYIFQDDYIGNRFMNLLVQKAKSGVNIKLIVDGFGCYKRKKSFYEPLRRAGGQVSIFFPTLLPFLSVRINYRNHRKLCIIDGITGFVGGFNIGDEYVGKNDKLGYWRDTHIMISGGAVEDMDNRFLLDWRYANGDKGIDVDYRPNYNKLAKNIRGDSLVQLVSSGPDSKWRNIYAGLIKMIYSSKNYIYIQTPYLVPDDSMLQALKIAALSGTDVRIIIPYTPDHFWVYWAGNSYISELMEAGVRIYKYKKGFIHSKTVVIDGNMSSIGTANMDIRSFELNFEVNAFIYDSIIGAKMELIFLNDLQDSAELDIYEFNNRPLKHRFIESIAKLFSPLL